MTQQVITIASAHDALLPAISELVLVQQARQVAHDPLLKSVDLRSQVEDALRESISAGALVALDAEGHVRGYAQPSLWRLKESSILLSFLSIRNGIVQKLTFPDPAAEDAAAVAAALLQELDRFWRREQSSGDLLRWPSSDIWFADALTQMSFQLDSICALRDLQPFFPSRPASRPSVSIRIATQEDEEALVKLFHEELTFHERYTPYVRSSASVLSAFRRKLSRIWEGRQFVDDAPLVLIAEYDGVVVGMAENTLLEVSPTDEPGFTPPGRYWCLDNVSVREEFQSRGIGRLLVQAIEDQRLQYDLDLDGYVLWFNPDNLSAARFWPRLGFQPLWTTYQRLHTTYDGR